MNEEKNNMERTIILHIDECEYSNPNGDPNREGEPRYNSEGYGEISSPSRRKKLRLIVENKNSELWKRVSSKYNLNNDNFQIVSSGIVNQEEAAKESNQNPTLFKEKYYDVRLYGCLKIYTDNQGLKITGPVQTGIGKSIGPILPILYETLTVGYSVKKGQSCTIAPNAVKVVPYGIYFTKETINTCFSNQSNCTNTDIAVFKDLIPYTWEANKSQSRTGMHSIHIHCITFNNPLELRYECEIIKALTPILKPGVQKGNSRDDFIIPTWDSIKDKYSNFVSYNDLSQTTL